MTVRPERPQSLGRGLASLIPQRHAGQPAPTEIPTDRIRSNPYQPRHHMDEAALATLAASIAEHGVVQPILVTEVLDGYQLVAGERRLRAAIAAGLDRIPAVIRQLADNEQLELALVENLQREDLDPIEAALAYRQLIDVFGYSHEAVATRVGRARTTVANTLRLLELDPVVQTALASGEITEGHARALGGLATEAQARVLGSVVEQALSVRQTEELVRRLREPRPEAAPKPQRLADPDLDRVEEDLRRALGTKVSLARSRKGGRIVIEFYSDEELGRLYERLTGGTA
jgi:ParB family chromosome partitioning protein